MPSSPRNRIGEIYGKLTVVRPSERRTKAGNAYWWCRCSCGAEREVPSDKLSLNTARRKPTVNACVSCARELQIEGVYRKNDREEKQRREEAIEARSLLKGQVPERWLSLPLTDAHARELGQKLFSRHKMPAWALGAISHQRRLSGLFRSDPICGRFAINQAQRVMTAAPNASMARSLASIQRKSKSSSDSPENAFMTRAEKGTKMAAITSISKGFGNADLT